MLRLMSAWYTVQWYERLQEKTPGTNDKPRILKITSVLLTVPVLNLSLLTTIAEVFRWNATKSVGFEVFERALAVNHCCNSKD
jgi:hypothetical protein